MFYTYFEEIYTGNWKVIQRQGMESWKLKSDWEKRNWKVIQRKGKETGKLKSDLKKGKGNKET